MQLFEVDPLPGGAYNVNTPALASTAVSDTGSFSVTFPWPVAGPGLEAGGPDILFRVTQNVGGSVTTIYEERPEKTHWNVANGALISLKVESPLAVCANPAPGTVPSNKLVLFTRIGSYPTAEIDCKGSTATSSGYLRPRKAPFSKSGMDTDMPLGGTADLFAWIGKLANVAYYKVQFSNDAGATWKDVESPLPNYWYDTSSPNPLLWHWVPESMGPFSDGGQTNLYKVPYLIRPDVPWSWLDRVAQFDTTRAANGLVRVKMVPYSWNAAHTALAVTPAADATVDSGFGQIVLQIDNTPPTAQILAINGGVAACASIPFGTTATDKISVGFRAYDPKGHLRSYELNAMYGHNQSVSPKPTAPNKAVDDYDHNATSSPSWQGNLGYATEYVGTLYPPAAMPSCAYQFRLGVSKRTTNGYGLIYPWVEDTWHVSIQRP